VAKFRMPNFFFVLLIFCRICITSRLVRYENVGLILYWNKGFKISFNV